MRVRNPGDAASCPTSLDWSFGPRGPACRSSRAICGHAQPRGKLPHPSGAGSPRASLGHPVFFSCPNSQHALALYLQHWRALNWATQESGTLCIFKSSVRPPLHLACTRRHSHNTVLKAENWIQPEIAGKSDSVTHQGSMSEINFQKQFPFWCKLDLWGTSVQLHFKRC